MAMENAQTVERFGCGASEERLEDDDGRLIVVEGGRLISFYATQNDMRYPNC